MDGEKLVICTEEDFVEHRNALDVINFERLDDLCDDDHLVIPTGKSFWESLNLVLGFFWWVELTQSTGDA